MKKTIQLLAVLLFMTGMCYAQGIIFEQGEIWQQIKEKAKKENKYIFMDCYATWCVPCKMMSKYIFPQKAAGDFMNEHFINVTVQMDRTGQDNDEVKKWYADAKALEEQYTIDAYPTYLFFSPDGKAVHRFTGSTQDVATFLARAKEALDPSQQYYTLIDNINKHSNDSVYLHKLMVKADHSNDPEHAAMIANAYIQSLKSPFNHETLSLVKHHITSSEAPTFKLFLIHESEIDLILREPGDAEKYVADVIYKERIKPLFDNDTPVKWEMLIKNIRDQYPGFNNTAVRYVNIFFIGDLEKNAIRQPYFFKENALLPNWSKIKNAIEKKWLDFEPQGLIDSMIAVNKYKYYGYKKMQPECDRAILDYMKQYGGKLGGFDTNGVCWGFVFMHSDNRQLLLKAAEWTKRFIPDSTDRANFYNESTTDDIDTYANLLYKAGRKREGIEWESKALDVLNQVYKGQFNDPGARAAKIDFEITLERMKRGESTWEGRNSHTDYDKL